MERALTLLTDISAHVPSTRQLLTVTVYLHRVRMAAAATMVPRGEFMNLICCQVYVGEIWLPEDEQCSSSSEGLNQPQLLGFGISSNSSRMPCLVSCAAGDYTGYQDFG
jgi:hypothetical protein